MTYKDLPTPRVIPVRVDAHGITWTLCEDCGRILPATRRHGGPGRVIPHLRDPRVTGRSKAAWPARQRAGRRLAWRCTAGGWYGRVVNIAGLDRLPVADVCAPCPVAAVARAGRQAGAPRAVAMPPAIHPASRAELATPEPAGPAARPSPKPLAARSYGQDGLFADTAAGDTP